MTIDDRTGRLSGDLIHEDRKGLGLWIEKHWRYAEMEAEALLQPPPNPADV